MMKIVTRHYAVEFHKQWNSTAVVGCFSMYVLLNTRVVHLWETSLPCCTPVENMFCTYANTLVRTFCLPLAIIYSGFRSI